jgi:hypothetical protein
VNFLVRPLCECFDLGTSTGGDHKPRFSLLVTTLMLFTVSTSSTCPPSCVAAHRSVLDDHGLLIDQATLAQFIDAGRLLHPTYGGAEESTGNVYRRSLNPLPNFCYHFFFYTDGGINLVGFLDSGEDDRVWSDRLKAINLEIPARSQYSTRPTRAGLIFGLTAFEQRTTQESMARR